MIYNRFNREISCHRITTSLHHCATMPPCHHVIASVSHLPCQLITNQSVICLASCHQTSQSFALAPATKPVSHLTCSLPLHHCITTSPCHCITMPLHYHVTVSPSQRVTTSPCHCIRFSPPHGYESDWLMLTSTVLIG